MSAEISENIETQREDTPSFNDVASLYTMLGQYLDLDGIYHAQVCVLRDFTGIPEDVISNVRPSLSHESLRFLELRPDSRPFLRQGIPYMSFTQNKDEKLKMLKKRYKLNIRSLNALQNEDMGVDGIGPSTTAL